MMNEVSEEDKGSMECYISKIYDANEWSIEVYVADIKSMRD